MFLINKDDLSYYVQFSANYFSEQSNFHIRDAQQIDLQPLMPTGLIDAITALIKTNPKAFDRNKTYAEGDICFTFDAEVKTYYKALQSTTEKPPGSDWVEHELLNFWQQYVKPLLAVYAFKRITVEAGIHVAQSGFREHLDPTSTEISSTRRAEMLGQNDTRIGYYKQALENKLKDVDNTFDGVQYTTNDCKTGRGRTRIIAVGAKRVYTTKRDYRDEYNNDWF